MYSVLEKLNEKSLSKVDFGAMLIENPGLIPVAIEGLDLKPASIKYGCSKGLLILSEKEPRNLYPYYDELLTFLTHENEIFRLTMILIYANLTSVDSENKFSKLFDDYYIILQNNQLKPAANVVRVSSMILKNKPELRDDIVSNLLEMQEYRYETEECSNIIYGHLIETFHNNMKILSEKHRESIIKFVEGQKDNTRSGTQKKAIKFLKKYRN